MASVRPRPAAMPTEPDGTPAKKRKVRKGTQSCWECKRRKIRCTFAAPTDAICDGCKSRQTKCIGQEYQDEPTPTGRGADRLKRMESIIAGLMKQDKYGSTGENDEDVSNSTPVQRARAATKRQSPSSLDIPLGLEAKTPEELSQYLLSYWPSQSDLDLIQNAQVCVSGMLHGAFCQPYDSYFEKHVESPDKILQRPPDGTHPVLVARSMLLLVTLLRSLPPSSFSGIPGLSISPCDMMNRLFNAATKLVTSNNDFMTCLEGIECCLMEIMFLSNLGNLRRAWLVNRRGLDLAQMLGMQTGKLSASIVVLERKTLERVRPDYMWFRLVCADRHLSLLLGFPQATTENVFATPDVLELFPPAERFERILAVACSLILQRNTAEQNDLDTTYEIDKTLQRAATLLPPQWWITSPPNIDTLANKDATAFQEALRLTNQFVYHHLLMQLHLPYMLVTPTTDQRTDCSKMTVANASRAILTRYISLHSSPTSTSYCRGIDFIAFIASTTLCLVHIEARRQQYFSQTSGNGFSLLQPLLHQRCGDRGILQRLLDIVVGMAKTDVDPTAQRIVSILGPLLEIELNSFKGGCYSVSAIDQASHSSEKLDTGPEFGDPSNAPHTLRIRIPYFGTIRIEHHPKVSKSFNPKEKSSPSQNSGYTAGKELSCDASPCSNDTSTGTLPIPTANCTFYCPQSLEGDWADISNSDANPSALVNTKNEPWADDAVVFNPAEVPEPYFLVPGPSSNDGWALQGVDVALFSSLMHGS